jgi:deazaflavin-dependent oxidoreductase (nitroreductase family)
MVRTKKSPIDEDRFFRALKDRKQISISVTGRSSGRTITLPVWFVLVEDALWLLPVYGSETQWCRNVQKNPEITIKAGSEQITLRARVVKEAAAVRRVIGWFRKKYTPEIVKRLYPGPLDVAVRVRLQKKGAVTVRER